MKTIRFGYSTNPKTIIITGTETINSLCTEHNVTINNSVVNHNGAPLATGFYGSSFDDINVKDGDSIIVVTKTNAA